MKDFEKEISIGKRNLLLRSLWFYALFLCVSIFIPSFADNYPALLIRGENYGIMPFEKGQQPFYNRTNMSFGDIPDGYSGWQYVKINANSTYIPGPLPSYEVKADEDGFLMAMVATAEKPDVCSEWAEKNGWEIVDGPTVSYAAGETGVMTFFRKEIKADEWTNVVQPATFSGALLIATSIVEDDPEKQKLDAVPVDIVSEGWMETGTLDNGSLAFANRAYVLCNVDQALSGLEFTRFRGGEAPKLKITAGKTGKMYIAVSAIETSYKPEEAGWTEVPDMGFYYNDGTSTSFKLYSKDVEEGGIVEIATDSWTGVLVISADITYKTIVDVLPPPGVVIFNSKASSKQYVGSPSITVLDDGTYLASHDIFGGIISYAYVYKSVDKGKTWTQISKIDPLNWAKLFTHEGKLYLIGVQPRCVMGYGNIVILRSDDGGSTWTKPVDGKSGLLKTGYYHTAPTPVVFHDGRVWKAMENQGDAYWGWGPFASLMLSADAGADLLNADSWTFSNELPHTDDAIGSTAWLEGNAVVAPDGSMKNILRMAYGGDDKAAVVSVSDDGSKATFNPAKDIVDLPGAGKKFTIRYDSLSARYWTLSNYVLSEDRPGNNDLGGVRNTVVLAWSEDLVHWTIKDTLLHHPDVKYHGFQYIDWQFDGNDIIAVSRTAWEDETGNADSQHNANFLTFHRFPNFRYERAGEDAGVRACRWQGGAESAFALTFDDGFKAHYDYAYPMLEKYGIRGTFYVNSGKLVRKGQKPLERYGFEEEFCEMSAAGHEIGSHSLTHPNLTAIDMETLRKELGQDKENIERFTGRKCLTHAYPYCLHNETVDKAMTSYYIAGRAGGNVANDVPSDPDGWYSTNSELLTWKYPRSLENEKASFMEMKSKIDGLDGRFGVVCIHETLPFNLLSTSNTYEVATTEWLEDMCAYLSELRSKGKMWPAPLADIVRYAEERRNLRVNRYDISGDSIAYEFSTWLDTAVYNVPLTLEFSVPAEWEAVRCIVKSGEELVSDSVYSSADGRITVNAVPDKETVLLVKDKSNAIGSADAVAEPLAGFDAVENIVYIKNPDYDVFCEIYDAAGRAVKSARCRASALSEINVAEMASGIYVARFSASGRKNVGSFSFAKCR